MSQNIKYGLLNGLVGFLIGTFITYNSIGNGYWIFIIAAPLAAFLCGSVIWKHVLKNDKTISKSIFAGLLTGLISHYVCWLLLTVGQNICYWTTENCTSSLGEPPISIFLMFVTGFGMTMFSLLIFGWITIPSAIGNGIYLQRNLKISSMKILVTLFISITLTFQLFSQDVEFLNYRGALSIGTQTNRTASITLTDIDNDGDLDALIANGRHWAEQNYIYYNNGKGAFKTAKPIGEYMDASYSMKSSDFNNDGFLDIVVVNDNTENKIYLGKQNNVFEFHSSFGKKMAPSRNMELGDLDNDGDIDIVISNRKAVNEICLNDGHGNFTVTKNFGDKEKQSIQTRVFDVNNDGYLDLVTANRKSKNEIFLNNGNLEFDKVIEFGEEDDDSRTLDLGDFNNDGFVDILIGNIGGKNTINFGSKEFTFEKVYKMEEENATKSIRVADLNNDDYLDIIEGNAKESNYVYLGNASNDFMKIELGEEVHYDTYNIEIGDINNDGYLDIIESNSGELNIIYLTKGLNR